MEDNEFIIPNEDEESDFYLYNPTPKDPRAVDEFIANLLKGLENVRGEVAGNDIIEGYTVDTCYTSDAGWETGICKDNGLWVIVQYYKDRESAELGHRMWVAICSAKPIGAVSVQTGQFERF